MFFARPKIPASVSSLFFSALLGVSAACTASTLEPGESKDESTSETKVLGLDTNESVAPDAAASTALTGAPITFSTVVRSGMLSFAKGSSQCLDVFGINRTAGAQVYIFTCNSGINQQFVFDQNRLVVYGDRCLEWTAGQNDQPGSVHIALCDPNQAQQKWLQGSDAAFHTENDPNYCLSGVNPLPLGASPALVSLCASANQLRTLAFVDAVATQPNLPINTVAFTRQPAIPSGIDWIDPPAGAQLFPSTGSLDWTRYIKQGAVGDCTFMAGLGAIATRHHEVVRSMIKQLGPHLYEASFYNTTSSYQTPASLMVKVQIDDKLPIWHNSTTWYAANVIDDDVTGKPVLFAALLEKAFALYVENYQLSGYPDRTQQVGYAGTTGNSPAVYLSLAGISNLDTDRTGFNSQSAWPLLNMAEQGYPVTSFKAQGTADGLPGGHVYYIIRTWSDASGTQMVTVRNPWGQDNASAAIKLTGSAGATSSMPYATYIAEFNEVSVGLLPGA